MITRRSFLEKTASSLALLGTGKLVGPLLAAEPPPAPAALPSGARDSLEWAALPGKKMLLKKTFRPPNYETPVSAFDQVFTPNDSFFVRYHLINIPEVKSESWRLRVGGEAADRPFEVGLADLRNGFETVELAAVCLCSGNRRGLCDPHVPGVQWAYGAMGNARWKGVRLRELLAKAALRKDVVEIAFDGADSGVVPKTPDFVKSLPLWKALDENTLVAFEMNGEPLPQWNGFPVRLVVPGWTATYWMKHLVSIEALARPLDSFWMKTAYRIPKGKFPLVDRFISQETEVNTPITEIVVSSLITNLADGQAVRKGEPVEVRGVAWDGGYGIARVEVSSDDGRSWQEADLGEDHGRFSFRQWSHRFSPPSAVASFTVMARATNRIGATQTFELIPNPGGYNNNVVQKLRLTFA
jgi:DMSO/TMAO reductase YedYZ molybdopterin-dependent catalytic subunit